ncbi:hypothetical protein JG687_00013575 [Phytophthora cactorum]|nr:hypothetical protein JG687_00013575 [Phytophthora cactorum]
MVSQPPRSPDLNVLDLGFFHSTQSLQHQTPTIDTDGLIAAVETAFGSVSYRTLGKCFITLQKVVGAIIATASLVFSSFTSATVSHQCHYLLTLRLSITVLLICTNQSSQPNFL